VASYWERSVAARRKPRLPVKEESRLVTVHRPIVPTGVAN